MGPSVGASFEGRYIILRELGSGGMATVYLADDMFRQPGAGGRIVLMQNFMTELREKLQ